MAQPANTTGWDSSNTNVVVPSGTKKALGWVVNEKPASGYFNWLLVTIEAWLVWVQGIYGYAASWVNLQTFLGGIQLNSPLIFSTIGLTSASNPNQIGNSPAPFYYASGIGATTMTLPTGAPIGTVITFSNESTMNLTIAPGAGGSVTATSSTTFANPGFMRLIQTSLGNWFQC